MAEKIPLLIAYSIIGLLLALWPLWPSAGGRSPELWHLGNARSNQVLSSRWRLIVGVVVGLVASSVLPWWRNDGGFGFIPTVGESAAFLVLSTIALAGLLATLNNPGPTNGLARPLNIVFVISSLALSFTTFSFFNFDVLYAAWHHWGAYIGPTELMLAGARAMRDFPLQYGLGPTLLIALTCDKSCWTGTYYLTGLLTFGFALTTFHLSLVVFRPVNAFQRCVLILLNLAATFWWCTNPEYVSSPIVTPSVSGMRFLPALALTAWLLATDRPTGKAVSFPYLKGHLAWAVCALWSIESAFYATCIWWPYYLLLCKSESTGNVKAALARRVLSLALVVASFVVFFLTSFWLMYRTTPTWMGVFAYIVNPPGPLPVNYLGPVWFLIAVIAVGTWTNIQCFKVRGHTAEFRHGIALSLLAYSTASYYLGRSHDNNILNLMPFLLLVLLHAQPRLPVLGRALASGLLAGVLAWPSIFGWNHWTDALEAKPRSWFDANWASRVMPDESGGSSRLTSAAQRVIERAQTLAVGPVTVAGPTVSPSSRDRDAVWSAYHGPANLSMFSSELRRDFLLRTAQTLNRSGWLLIWKDEQMAVRLIPDFDSAYTRTHNFEMEGYLAIHYAPKPLSFSSQPNKP